MSEKRNQKQKKDGGQISIADLYPGLTSEQRADAEKRLLGYLEIVKQIFERVCRENPKLLTELEARATLREKGRTAHLTRDSSPRPI